MTSNGAVTEDATVPAIPPAKKLAGSPSFVTIKSGTAVMSLSGLCVAAVDLDSSALHIISTVPLFLSMLT